MALSPALMDLIAGWYDWVAQPNIDPSEMRETALNRVFTCIMMRRAIFEAKTCDKWRATFVSISATKLHCHFSSEALWSV